MTQLYKKEIYLIHKYFLVVLMVLAAICLVQLLRTPALNAVPALVLFVLFLDIPILFGKLTVTVEDGVLEIAFGYAKVIRKKIPLADIVSAEPVTYRPIRDFGGWGIRCGNFDGQRTSCLTMSGNTGVLLTLADETRVCLMRTKRLIIGVDDPEELAGLLLGAR